MEKHVYITEDMSKIVTETPGMTTDFCDVPLEEVVKAQRKGAISLVSDPEAASFMSSLGVYVPANADNTIYRPVPGDVVYLLARQRSNAGATPLDLNRVSIMRTVYAVE